MSVSAHHHKVTYPSVMIHLASFKRNHSKKLFSRPSPYARFSLPKLVIFHSASRK